MKNFQYLIDKIKNSKIIDTPYQHIYIENFFNDEDFAEITNSDAVNTKNYKNNDELFQSLFNMGYKSIDFPGCINNAKEYNEWHINKKSSKKLNTTCEGFGMTLRLMDSNPGILEDLKNFIESKTFQDALASKFKINTDKVYSDNGLQKYLDGYEISPHPDIRKKALTYMININPHHDSEELNHHTHYLKLKKEYKYIQEFWKSNKQYDRCWVPWSWAETVFIQNQNNTLVMFSPTDETIHAVKASYNHLLSQRTQLYGNLWFNESPKIEQLSWEDMVISAPGSLASDSTFGLIKSKIPLKIKNLLKFFFQGDDIENYSSVRNNKDK